MKNTAITVVILAAVGIGGFVWYQNRSKEEALPPAETALEAPTPMENAAEAVDEAAESVSEKVEGAVESTAEAVEGAADNAAKALGDITESVTEAASDAVEAVSDAVTGGDSMEATQGAVTEATDTVADTAADTAQAGAAAATDAADTAGDTMDAGVATVIDAPDTDVPADAPLTQEGFDADRIIEMINASDLDAMRKSVLRSAVEQARSNPALVDATITQVKTALGM